MNQIADSLFSTGIERYQAGEGPSTLIPVFKDICDRAPKNSNAWTCLAWLYLLDDKPTLACKAAKSAVKCNPQDPQARVNLAISMLASGQKGVRQHIDLAQQLLMVSDELRQEVKDNLEEGLSRKADWDSLKRVKAWLFEP